MNWTDERVELLKKLWAEGLSASQIANQLGGVSRNAVIGKVHRLKLSGRGRTSSSTPRPKKSTSGNGPSRSSGRATRQVTTTIGATALQARFDTEADPHAAPRPHENIVIPIPLKLKLVELTEQTCKWPIGDPLSEEFAFCGTDVGECGPYCSYHSRLAYQPANERRRPR